MMILVSRQETIAYLIHFLPRERYYEGAEMLSEIR